MIITILRVMLVMVYDIRHNKSAARAYGNVGRYMSEKRNILVVGGTGLIGGHAALHLKGLGHDVTIASRTPPAPGTPLAELPFVKGDYLNPADFPVEMLAGFDTLVFAAGNDLRHKPEGVDEAAHFERANVQGVPAFFAKAREAGIARAIHIGSFYPQVDPSLADSIPYVRSRKLACEAVRALSGDGFVALSLNAPFVVGTVPGLDVPMFQYYTRFAEGALGLPPTAPPGGTNFISTQSLSEAVAGAIARGEGGRAYLVGDENLSFRDYFAHFFRAVGSDAEVRAVDEEHPLLPDGALYAGRGADFYYETDDADVKRLGYGRNDIRRAVDEIVAQYRS